MTDEAPKPFDVARLIHDVRTGDAEAVARAYRLTFDTDLGRLVLAHHLTACGVGNGLGPDNLKYAAGMHDGALQLANMAGFDQAAIAVAVLTDNLEGRTDDPPHTFAAPEPDDLLDV